MAHKHRAITGFLLYAMRNATSKKGRIMFNKKLDSGRVSLLPSTYYSALLFPSSSWSACIFSVERGRTGWIVKEIYKQQTWDSYLQHFHYVYRLAINVFVNTLFIFSSSFSLNIDSIAVQSNCVHCGMMHNAQNLATHQMKCVLVHKTRTSIFSKWRMKIENMIWFFKAS